VSTGSDRKADAERVRSIVRDDLKVHVRIADQGRAPNQSDRRRLAAALPDLSAFGSHKFHTVRVLLDWDHQIPSQYVILRIFCCYDRQNADRIDAFIDDRDREIDEGNLYPEFDVPDYGDMDASESYAAVLRPGSTDIEDFRFLSAWRKQVHPSIAEAATKIVRADPSFQKIAAARTTSGLGGPVVIGWAPPCLADCESWAIEIWLLTEFDGQSGKARVFMVDIESDEVSREFDTDVQLA
jgi:hypothetical protein